MSQKHHTPTPVWAIKAKERKPPRYPDGGLLLSELRLETDGSGGVMDTQPQTVPQPRQHHKARSLQTEE